MSGIMGMLLGAKTAIAAAVDEFFNRVTLLLPGDGTNGAQNNTFLDSSTNNFTITRNGNTTQGTFSPFSQTGWSNYFDGSGDSLVTPSNSAFDPSGQNVTVDFFVYFTRYVAANNIVFEVGNSSVGDLQCNIVNTGEVRFTTGGNTGSTISGFTLNTWHYITCVKSGTNLTVYLNGTAGTTVSLSPNSKTTLYIGAQSGGTNMDGYISNFRYVRGSANVPSGVPTSPLTAITNTSLLTCQSNRFIDNSTNAFALTVNGNVSVQAFSPFAPTAAYSAATVGGSGYFDGTGDYLSVADNAALDMGSSSFTMEFWTYLTGTPSTYQAYISKRANTGTYGGVSLYLTSGRALNLQATLNGSTWGVDITTSSTVPLNSWTHVAVVRNGDAWAVYINGVSGANTTVSGTVPDNSSAFMICAGAADGSHPIIGGYIGDFRVVKGTAVYTGAFTPPTAPLTAITNTSLLTNFTNAGITDATAKNVLETVGNAQISTTQSKFGGSSMYFDGTGDYLKVPSSPNLALGTGDFTVEFWAYPTTFVNYSQWVSTRVADDASYWGIDSNSSGVFYFFTNGIVVQSSAQSLNTWVHIAAVRSGTTFKLYINGVSAGSATLTNNFLIANGLGVGAGANGAQTAYGYIDDVRITRGYARYTSNFTPPTAAFALQ